MLRVFLQLSNLKNNSTLAPAVWNYAQNTSFWWQLILDQTCICCMSQIICGSSPRTRIHWSISNEGPGKCKCVKYVPAPKSSAHACGDLGQFLGLPASSLSFQTVSLHSALCASLSLISVCSLLHFMVTKLNKSLHIVQKTAWWKRACARWNFNYCCGRNVKHISIAERSKCEIGCLILG